MCGNNNGDMNRHESNSCQPLKRDTYDLISRTN